MGEALAKVLGHAEKVQKRKSRDGQLPSSREERGALRKLRIEARRAGTTLASGGKGGLPPSLVLHVMRRDGYACKVCGAHDNISVHHKGGIPASPWLEKKDHSNDPNNIVTICQPCHDEIHEKARAEGIG